MTFFDFQSIAHTFFGTIRRSAAVFYSLAQLSPLKLAQKCVKITGNVLQPALRHQVRDKSAKNLTY